MGSALHTITEVKALQRPRGYCAVWVDGSLVLRAHRRSVEMAGLTPGRRLDAEELKEKVTAAQQADALRQAVESLAIRDRSETELRRMLTRRQFPQPIIATVLERLRNQGLINDRRYAREYVRTQGGRRGIGPAALRARLARRGVAPEVVDEALSDELPDETQESIALTLARKQLSRLRTAHKTDNRPRLYEFLVRRGFDDELAARVVEHLLDDYND